MASLAFALYPRQPENVAPGSNIDLAADWIPVDATNEASAGQIVGAAAAAVRALEGDIEDAGALADLVCAVLSALITMDGREYVDYVTGAGARLDRDMVESLAMTWVEWGLLDRPAIDELNDKELFLLLWSTAPARMMRLSAIDAASISAGRGIRFAIGRPDWPYAGVRSRLSLFQPGTGRLTRERGDRLDGTSASAHVPMRIRFADETPGHIRLDFYFDEQTRRWWPLVISIGASGQGQWPFPLL